MVFTYGTHHYRYNNNLHVRDKGKSPSKVTCAEIQKDMKYRHKRHPFKNIMKFYDMLYVIIMEIISAYELMVNRSKM